MLAYLNLTKPRISLLFAVTGLTALTLEKSVGTLSLRFWLIGLALFMVGGSANAFNQYFERDRDKKMSRTAKKRPIPQGMITPQNALIFSICMGIVGNLLLFFRGGRLAALLGVGTIGFYSFYYTLWLKPRTPYNIVIGGIAGAMGPLIGWAAVTGKVGLVPFLMFLIIFFWTPPHFWALALCWKEDYKKVGLPMLPLVAGDAATRKQIFSYSLVLLPLSLSLFLIRSLGGFYLVSSTLLSLLFIAGAYRIYRQKSNKTCWQFFGYSIFYLLLLFGAMMVDGLMQ